MGNCHKIIPKDIDSLSALHLPSCYPRLQAEVPAPNDQEVHSG